MKKIKWLIAHEPQHLFIRTANAFKAKIAELTNGEIDIELLTDTEFQEQFGLKTEVTFKEVIDALQSNQVQMSQTQVHFFADFDPNYRVFDMPYLFESHEHVTKVTEGPIGRAMGDRLAKAKSGIRGLAFTYSGGHRVIGSEEPITSVKELLGKRINVNSNPVNSDFLTTFGAEPRVVAYNKRDEYVDADAIETTYLRYTGKHVLKTNHNMFMTTIIVNDQIWSSLTASEQESFREAAIETARLERKWSIEDAAEFERTCAERGVTITTPSDEEIAHSKSLSKEVYEKWNSRFLPGLLDEIKKLH